ncbi:long-chain-fatty-acid--CoA ligase [Streptomyces sp. Qhu_M48]|uniref:long-chain-fatty-acid--CoA ligase n=1 Tax=Streptomyces sp. Qhu_M48 TaxID=3435889 RepID=UPI003F50762A
MTLSLAAVLAESAHRHADRVAVVDGGVRITYARLWAEALAQAGALRGLGIGQGDRVALMMPNCAGFPRSYYAILATGAVVVPVHLLLTADEIAYVLRDADVRLLVCAEGLMETGAAAAATAGVPVIGARTVEGSASEAWVDTLEAVAGAVGPLTSYESTDPGDPAVIFYTSGTTGRPKGAILTHLNLVMNATVNAFDVIDLSREDVALGCLPLFHTFGQSVSMNALFRIGGTLVMQTRFDPHRALDLMVEEGVTVFHGVPTMYVALLAAARARPSSTLPKPRYCVSGGAPLPVSVHREAAEVFGAQILEGYGLSETSPSATVHHPGFGVLPGTVGHPVWGVDVGIARADVEDSVELLPAGVLGEIVVRGHNVFAGYFGRPEETAKALVDGWFRTGDLGTKDSDGFVSVVDRKKDLVIRGGFNIYPREVEEVLLDHPSVAEVAVIGLPHPAHGEEVCAVVVPTTGEAGPPDGAVAFSEDELRDWSRTRLGRHKYPRIVVRTDSMPLGPSHKVLKRELRQRYAHLAATADAEAVDTGGAEAAPSGAKGITGTEGTAWAEGTTGAAGGPVTG